MSDSKKHANDPDTLTRFKVMLEDIPAFFIRAPENQKRVLLDFLENWKHSLRRKHPRKSCAVPVDFTDGDRAFKSFLQNIGAGGVFIETTKGWHVGQQIALTFSLPNVNKPTKLNGEIVWGTTDGFGVMFKSNPYFEELFAQTIEKL
jgi:Tfp pilus assembly protein PilZ